MEVFFLWISGTIVLLAGYLSVLWWWPRKKKKSGRFQVRLTILFLLFALVPAVPLTFLVSTLYTRSMEIFLIPQIESSLLKSLDITKYQLEDRARLFVNAVNGVPLTPAALAQWQIDFYLSWRQDGATAQLVSVVGSDAGGRQRGLSFGVDRIMEVWGQTGSQLTSIAEVDANTTTTYCHVWMPRPPVINQVEGGQTTGLQEPQAREMLVIGFKADPYIVTAKREISDAARIYNSLALIKESLLNEKILWSAAALFIMLLSAFSVWAARRFSRRLSKPIELLTAATAEVAAGNLNIRAEIPARDEIGELVNSFNRMIEDLRASREKLIASERLAAWREVARQVSHEIKNPLTTIQLALYRLRQRLSAGAIDTANAAVLHESFQSLDEELDGLRHLAEEFSDFARFPKTSLAPANLNEIVQMTARLHSVSDPDRIKIHLDLDPDLPVRPIDREQIKRLLNNLLKNAMEAAPLRAQPNHYCEVHIKTRRREEHASLEIADNGPGLPPEIREHVFEPHFTTKRLGSGLGLAIVKRIVEEHGGSIEVESEPEKGTRFRVVI
jgi:nitrogen fixation/metabolism regulation signal transduction histidine kinase